MKAETLAYLLVLVLIVQALLGPPAEVRGSPRSGGHGGAGGGAGAHPPAHPAPAPPLAVYVRGRRPLYLDPLHGADVWHLLGARVPGWFPEPRTEHLHLRTLWYFSQAVGNEGQVVLVL